MKKIILMFAAGLLIGNAALFAQSTTPSTTTPSKNSGTVKSQPNDGTSSGSSMGTDQTKPTSDQSNTNYHARKNNGKTNGGVKPTNKNRSATTRNQSSTTTSQPPSSTTSSPGNDGSSQSTTTSQQRNDNNSTTPATTTTPSTRP